MSVRFDFTSTPLAELRVIHRKPIEDKRGIFERIFCEDDFQRIGFRKGIVQINRSLTRNKGTVRGMHFQYPPYAETKIISCLNGKVFDVAVDIRMGSPTFLVWHAEILSPDNGKSILIPEGFAHGFQTLTDICELLYLHTEFYAPQFEGGLNAQDPILGIEWPVHIDEMSDRDRAYSLLTTQFEGIAL